MEDEILLHSFDASSAQAMVTTSIEQEIVQRLSKYTEQCVCEIKKAIAAGSMFCTFVLDQKTKPTDNVSTGDGSKSSTGTGSDDGPIVDVTESFYKHFTNDLKFSLNQSDKNGNQFTIRWHTELTNTLPPREIAEHATKAEANLNSKHGRGALGAQGMHPALGAHGAHGAATTEVFTAFHAIMLERKTHENILKEKIINLIARCLRAIRAHACRREQYLEYTINYAEQGLTKEVDRILVFDEVVKDLRDRKFLVEVLSKPYGRMKIACYSSVEITSVDSVGAHGAHTHGPHGALNGHGHSRSSSTTPTQETIPQPPQSRKEVESMLNEFFHTANEWTQVSITKRSIVNNLIKIDEASRLLKIAELDERELALRKKATLISFAISSAYP